LSSAGGVREKKQELDLVVGFLLLLPWLAILHIRNRRLVFLHGTVSTMLLRECLLSNGTARIWVDESCSFVISVCIVIYLVARGVSEWVNFMNQNNSQRSVSFVSIKHNHDDNDMNDTNQTTTTISTSLSKQLAFLIPFRDSAPDSQSQEMGRMAYYQQCLTYMRKHLPFTRAYTLQLARICDWTYPK
jgi:hypothetical protein